MSRMLMISVLVLATAACSRAERSETPGQAHPTPTQAATATVAPAPDATPAPVDVAPLTGPASPAAIEAMAAGTYDLDPMVQPRMSVIEVIGAAEDPSGRGGGHPRETRVHCRAKAKAAIIATARAMVDRAKKYGSAIECDHQFVTTPDPAFGAVPAGPKVAARPGHEWRYAVCTSPGLAEYDRTLQLYFIAPSMHIVGILDTEVGSSLNAEDLATLDGALMAEIVRCP